MKNLTKRLEAVRRAPDTISPSVFAAEGILQANTPGKRSRIARLRVDTVHALRSGPSNPLQVMVPAFEDLGQTDGTADNTETFNLGEDVVQQPNVADVVVWLDGIYYGPPDAVDYANDTIDVTDAGTNSQVYAYYVAAGAAELTVEKSVPSSTTDSSEELYGANLPLVHETNQSEQPEFLELDESELQRFVAADMTLDVYLDAPYQVRFTDPNGDGTEPTNALLDVPVLRGRSRVEGLLPAIKADMGSR